MKKIFKIVLYVLIMTPLVSSAITVADAMPITSKDLQKKKAKINQYYNPNLFGKCTNVGLKIQASEIQGVKFSDSTVITAALLINAGAIYMDELIKKNPGAKNALDNLLNSSGTEFQNIPQEKFNMYMQECMDLMTEIIKK